MRPTPTRWCRSPRRNTRRWGATTPVGAGAGRNSSCAMAPPEGAAAEAPRDFATELEESEGRLTEAERYLGLDRLLARQAELEAAAADPKLWDDGDNARAVTTELG